MLGKTVLVGWSTTCAKFRMSTAYESSTTPSVVAAVLKYLTYYVLVCNIVSCRYDLPTSQTRLQYNVV